jgi:predicted metal-dependent hydrolase
VTESIYPTDNFPVPIRIIVERRNFSRISLGKKEIIIRIPKQITNSEKQKTIQKFLLWAKEQIQTKQIYSNIQTSTDYYQNRVLSIYGKEFIIQLNFINEGKNKLSFRGDNTLHIYLLQRQSDEIKIKEIQRFLLRFTEKYFLSSIQQRTLYFNEHYFKESIEKVVLKHTISCWGSCTTKRRLLFSTKLLLAPTLVIDYVIVHELAHLKEMNHSAKFWEHVENAMPNYKSYRLWLKQHGNKLEF